MTIWYINKTYPLTIIGEDVTTLAFIDDMTLSQLFSPGLVWAAQVLCGQLCDCALQEVSSDARLGQSWCSLFKEKGERYYTMNNNNNKIYDQ